MPSSPTVRNRLEKQGQGENLNTWGQRLNEYGLELLDESLDGVETVAIGSAAVVLTSTNYASDQARNRVLKLTGTLTANTTVTAPGVEKVYLVDDQTTRAGFTLTIKTAAGIGYALRPGPQWAYCDGADFSRGTPRLDQVPLPSSAVDMNAQRLSNMAQGTAATDAVTKAQMETAIANGALPASPTAGAVKVTSDDTAAQYLDGAISVSASLTKTVTNPGADETLVLGLSDTGVTAGVYDAATLAIDAEGRVTAAARSGWAVNNILLLFLKNEIQDAVAGGAMQDGLSDAFTTDTLGATSTGEYWDSAGKYYRHTPLYSYANAGGSGNRAGSITVSTGLAGSGTVDNIVDGGITANTTDGWFPTSGQTSGSVQFDFGVAATKYFAEARIKFNASFSGGGTWKWRGSNDGSSWTDISGTFTMNQGATTTTVPITGTAGPWRHLECLLVSGSTDSTAYWLEAEFSISSAADAATAYTLMSPVVTAEAQPDDARLVLLHNPVGTVTLNTDIIASVSRDGGTTWTAAALTDEGAYDATYDILAGTADLSGQPAGTSMRWKIECGAVEQHVRAVAMMWG